MENIRYYISDFIFDKLVLFTSDKIKVGEDEPYPLHAAVVKKDIMKIFKLLKTMPVDAEKPGGKTPLIEASLRPFTARNIEVMKLLLRKGASPTKQYYYCSPAYNIFLRNNMEMMHFLLKYMRDVNHSLLYDLKLMDFALMQGNGEIVKALIDEGANLRIRNYEGLTYLHQAAFNEDVPLVNIFLDAGMDVNAQDNYGRTALHYAAEKYNLLSLKAILDRKPNINAVDRRHNTAANFAAKDNFSNCYNVLKILLEHGCDINIPDNNRNTPLHNLLTRFRPSIPEVCLLIDHGAEINSLNIFGESALHLAVRGNHEHICDLLLRLGSKMDGRTVDGLTPLEMNIRSSQSVLCVIKHLAIAQHLKKEELDPHISGVILSNPISREFWNNCCDEITRLDNNCKVEGSNLNYTMLYFLDRKVINSLRNEEFREKISSSEPSAFPIYGNILHGNFLSGCRARMLVDSAEEYLYTLFGDRLPYDCIEYIVTCFSAQDLELLIENSVKYRIKKKGKKNRYYLQYLLVMHATFIGAALMMK